MTLVIVPLALAELHDAASFYKASANTELALAFLVELEKATGLLLKNTDIGSIFRGNARRFPLRILPYTVIYQVCAEELRIFAFEHQSRRPGYWIKRA